ncbi:MAG TPA: tRNA (adenosine(37)-N6)-threonylcarbamoyltransferase complex transferase subunit TsaD [Terriglobia bacterium]|nr:tRNA (adenosine(37)-N6)-threonylcarbamoyltransferase complex transferase subunit TsaD [Terriglobia bacterium]
MRVLGIESSCDETAAAVVVDGERILSSVVASQVLTHARYGGVVPELASREHLRKIIPVVEEACREAGVALPEVDAVAVTEGPGLIGSLLVGLVYAKALALSLGKPLVGVNHLEGHIHAVMLQNHLVARERLSRGSADGASLFPCVTLVVSGGHTSLFRVDARGLRKSSPQSNVSPVFAYTRLGQTRDDAAGEAFDKVAKLLALGYPGGPIVDRLARAGNSEAVDFGRIRMKGNPLDFSFSGLKTAVLYRVRGTQLESEAAARHGWRKNAGRVTAEEVRSRCSQATLDLVASFQRAVVTDLVDRTLAAADQLGSQCVFVSGGVAANSLLRELFAAAAARAGIEVFFPSLALSTDNAAMIAAAGYYKLMAGERADSSLTAHASFPLGV